MKHDVCEVPSAAMRCNGAKHYYYPRTKRKKPLRMYAVNRTNNRCACEQTRQKRSIRTKEDTAPRASKEEESKRGCC